MLNFLNDLKSKLNHEIIVTDPARCAEYSSDNSSNKALPEVLVLATDSQQIVTLITLCNHYRIPLTTRGRGTGTTGAAVPIQGGVLLSLEKMNRILKLDIGSRILIAEAGVINQTVQEEAKNHGFFWAPDPASSAICSIGGNIGCNAAGPRAVKYGSTRENVLGLTAVTGAGDIIKTGVHTTKNAVGYDLTRLLIGSEGTLAIVTEAILKLLPLPENVLTLQAFYRDIHSATEAVSAIMAQGLSPSALEYVDGKALAMISAYAQVVFPKDAQAMLIIEVDVPHSAMQEAQEKITRVATNSGVLSIVPATSEAETKKIWQTRKALSPALRTIAPKKINEDVVVPVAKIPQLISGIESLANQYQINIINFGHAGNGNIHVNLMLDPKDANQVKNAEVCLEKIFDLVLQLEGSLSGEHGVGMEKRAFLSKQIDPPTLDLMRKIKQQFDPNNILNPGKIFP